jgi:tetratricopeptide (TPR) repeat protein
MNHKKEQTIRQYAKVSLIPLKQALVDLKSSGFSCNADSVLDQKMRMELLACFRKRQRTPEGEKKTEELKQQKEAKAEDLKRQKEAKAEDLKRQKEAKAEELKRQKEANADEIKQQNEAKVEELKQIVRNPKSKFEAVFNAKSELEIRKIGILLDLCCELIPAPIRQKINNDCFHPGISVLESYLYSSTAFKVIPKWIIDDYGLVRVPTKELHRYPDNEYLPPSIEQYNNFIKNHIKHNRYTAALIETIYFLLATRGKYSNFNDLHIIGELLIDMGAIDSALRLYNIDERVFSAPNRLSLLANKSVQSGNLDDSIKLVGKLIEQEPYHPSIPTIQAEIKRLEQRHRLKATFSIDFSKVDELSGVEFENLLMDKFSSLGFKVESTPKTGDFGADLIVENNEGSRIIVQCKRFKSKVNLKAVQEVVGAMGHYAGDMGIVITNNSFLNSAIKLAESHDIELWDGDKLVSFLAGDLLFSEIMGVIE